MQAGQPVDLEIATENPVTGESMLVQVDYNNLPIRCRLCLSTSHLIKDCERAYGQRKFPPTQGRTSPPSNNREGRNETRAGEGGGGGNVQGGDNINKTRMTTGEGRSGEAAKTAANSRASKGAEEEGRVWGQREEQTRRAPVTTTAEEEQHQKTTGTREENIQQAKRNEPQGKGGERAANSPEGHWRKLTVLDCSTRASRQGGEEHAATKNQELTEGGLVTSPWRTQTGQRREGEELATPRSGQQRRERAAAEEDIIMLDSEEDGGRRAAWQREDDDNEEEQGESQDVVPIGRRDRGRQGTAPEAAQGHDRGKQAVRGHTMAWGEGTADSGGEEGGDTSSQVSPPSPSGVRASAARMIVHLRADTNQHKNLGGK